MSLLQAEGDAGFYELVHRILIGSGKEMLQERRIRPRMEFDTYQRIAPCRGSPPREEDFVPVRCFDLNRGGLAFFLDQPPDFQRLVVELACTQKRIRLTAEVVHFMPVLVFPNGDIVPEEAREIFDDKASPEWALSERKILVGCRFLSRWKPCDPSGDTSPPTGDGKASGSSGAPGFHTGTG